MTSSLVDFFSIVLMGLLAHSTSKDISNAVNSYWRSKLHFLRNSRINRKLENLSSCLCETLLVLDTRVSFSSIYNIATADLFDASKRMWEANKKLNHAMFELKTDITMNADPEFYQVLEDISQLQIKLAKYLGYIAIECEHNKYDLAAICTYYKLKELSKQKMTYCQSLIGHRARNSCSLI